MRRVLAIAAVLVAGIGAVLLLADEDDAAAPCGTVAVERDPDVALTDDPGLALISYLTLHGDGGVIRGSDWPQTADEPARVTFTNDNVTVVVRREGGGWRATEKRVDCG